MQVVAKHLRQQAVLGNRHNRRVGVRQKPTTVGQLHRRCLMNYLDDFVGSASTHAAAKRFATDARTLMQRLGLSCKEHKCHWDPSRTVTALGVKVNSELCTFELTDRRKHSIVAAAQQVLKCAQQNARHVPKKLLARVCGRAVSAMLAVPYARFKLQHLYACMRQQGGWHAYTKVRLTHAAMRDARWWCTRANLDSTRPWVPPAHTAVLTTDSSDFGWGAVLERAQQRHEAQGTWPPPVACQHITLKELMAVRMALTSFVTLVRGRCVHVQSDATAVVHTLTVTTVLQKRGSEK